MPSSWNRDQNWSSGTLTLDEVGQVGTLASSLIAERAPNGVAVFQVAEARLEHPSQSIEAEALPDLLREVGDEADRFHAYELFFNIGSSPPVLRVYFTGHDDETRLSVSGTDRIGVDGAFTQLCEAVEKRLDPKAGGRTPHLQARGLAGGVGR